jgi:hypothetical protein
MQDVSTSARYDAAVTYIRDRRWALIPLHHVLPDGACSCRFAATDADHQAGGKSVGKHPISKGWQSGPPMSLADAFSIWGDSTPDANIGIRTGAVSGIFVLDVDPDNGGMESFRLMQAANGGLPHTYSVRTGSGGWHFYFRLPSAFRVSNGANRLLVQKYGPGLDIRGEGGQVVAAPSVSGKGAYTVLDDAEPADAPGWLLELLQATVDTMPVTDSPVVEDLPVVADLRATEAARVQRYAEHVLAQEEAGYIEAPPGTGNQALFTAACNMIEIAQSPWNTVTVAEVWKRLERARLARRDMHPEGGGQDPQEFTATWESARARVIGQGRALPPDPNQGITFDPGLFLPEGETPGTPPPATREEALSLVDQMEAMLLDASELAKMPAPRPLVHGLLDLDSGAWLIGAPGSFKSFVALDLAGHVGLGRDWQGHRVTKGEVIYLAAEGARGMTLRTRAWEEVNGPMTGVKFLPLPLQYAGEKVGGQLRASVEWETLTALVRRRQPSLIVIDTQARVTAGMDENSNGDMGAFARAVTMMQGAAGGACVLVVHHTGRSGGDARGASAIDGAQDTELKVERLEPRSDLRVKLMQDKQKDQADSTDAITLQLRVIDMGEDPETGRALSSLVIGQRDPFQSVPVQPWVRDLPESKRRILEVLREHGGLTMGLTKAEIRAVLKERGLEINKTTFYRALEQLLMLDHSGEPLIMSGSGEKLIINSGVYDAHPETDNTGS